MNQSPVQKEKPLIGFIGQGFIGKNYADDFENRGYTVIRYATRPELAKNKDDIKNCDIVFIAVPTPSTPNGFDYSIVREVLKLVGKEKTAVIKSTVLPGTTEKLQAAYPDIFVFHSPEFLREKTAAYDAANPDRNIIGIPKDTSEYKRRAKLIIANLLYDVAKRRGRNWEAVKEAVAADPRIGPSHMEPLHRSGHGGGPGRGAGGHCFIKDLSAFSKLYAKAVKDPLGSAILAALEIKNNRLLLESGKDANLLKSVYGSLKRARNP